MFAQMGVGAEIPPHKYVLHKNATSKQGHQKRLQEQARTKAQEDQRGQSSLQQGEDKVFFLSSSTSPL